MLTSYPDPNTNQNSIPNPNPNSAPNPNSNPNPNGLRSGQYLIFSWKQLGVGCRRVLFVEAGIVGDVNAYNAIQAMPVWTVMLPRRMEPLQQSSPVTGLVAAVDSATSQRGQHAADVDPQSKG